MKLIRESDFQEVELIQESIDDQKNLYISGPFLQQEVVNKNGRYYSAKIMEAEANRYINEKVLDGKAWGELNHPDTPKIDFNNVSHRIVSLVQEGNNWIGKALILNNEKGKIVRSLMESGGKIGVSSRGLGTLIKNSKGINEVQSDFRLMTAADIVADPSAPDAFVNGILESKDWIWDNGIVKEAEIANYSTAMKTVSASEKNNMAIKLFENFLAKLSR